MALSFAFQGHAGFGAVVKNRLAEAGFAQVDDVAAADAVLTYCTSLTQLEDVYFGDDGLVSIIAPGGLLVDMSATTPNIAREISAVATVSELEMVEAPLVVADMARACAFDRENLSCFAAGEEQGLERALPLLEALCGSVHEAGGPGAAQLARAAYTLQVVAQAIAIMEADALYHAVRRQGIGSDLGVGHPGAAGGQAASMLEAMLQGRYEGAYTVEMLMSELAAAIMTADDADLILPQAESASHLLELLAVIGGAQKAPAALSLIYGEEEKCAQAGLDWTRAEQVYGQDDGGSAFGGGDDYDDIDFGVDDFGFEDSFGTGFGYSSN